MPAIFKREFKAYYQNIIGWLFMAAVLALYGLYYFAYNLRGGSPYISYSLSAIAFIMLIAAPILTMRCLAEERHSRTDQLILTSPLTVGKIVVGKYLAMLAVLTIVMAIIAVTPLLLSIYGTVPMGESYVAILGFWLYGAACIAIGMFLSALTESQVIAAVLTFIVLFLGYMMQGITGMLGTSLSWLAAILNCYDIYTPMYQFMNGSLSVTGMVYFVGLIVIFLFLSTQAIQKRRWSISSKKVGTSVFSVSTIAITLAIVVIVNIFVGELPETVTSIDATSNKLYSLTDETKEYLKQLEKDVDIYVLVNEEKADETVAETLKRYDAMSDHITVTYKNPSVNPTFYQPYTDSAPASNSLIVVSDERYKVISYTALYEYTYDYSTYSSTIEGYDAEGQITSAIEYVTMDAEELPIIYEIEGHGETALEGNFKESLQKANITLESLTLLTVDEIPETAEAIIINGPASDFSTDDAQKVIAYIKNGGNVMVNCDFEYQDLSNFESILEEFGMARVKGIVMDNNQNYYYAGTPYYLLPDVEVTDYTSSVTNSYIFAPYSEGISYGEGTEDISYVPLLITSEDAVSKTDSANATTSEFEEGDIAGPLSLSVAMEYQAENGGTARMVVSGSTKMYADSADTIVSGNNSELFTDIISQMYEENDLSLSVIPVKEYTLGTITVSAGIALFAGFGFMLLIPLMLLIVGIVVWAMRRKR